MLSNKQAEAYYDRFGAKQDKQTWYERGATSDLIDHADFAHAQRVVEFGCGTGRFAADLLTQHLPSTARYLAIDQSTTMTRLAQDRLHEFADRAAVVRTKGVPHLPVADGWADRFVSAYVFDLLAFDAVRALLVEARRVLRPYGLLCLVGLTHGESLRSRSITTAWTQIYRRNPQRVGGCRPMELHMFLSAPEWHIEYSTVVTAWGLPSQVIVAWPLPAD